jgi:stress response protein SCP2
MVQNCFIRVFDADTKNELCKYTLSENYDNMTAMIVGEIYRHGSDWKFCAIGQSTADGSLDALARKFM